MTRFRELREAHNYTQDFVAEAIGVSRITYVRYENGGRQIKVSELINLAKLYHVSIDYLLGLTDVAVWDKKIDPLLIKQERASDRSNSVSQESLTEDVQKYIEQCVDIAIRQALDKRGTPSDDPEGPSDHSGQPRQQAT